MSSGPWKRSDDEGENILSALKHPLRRRLLAAFRDDGQCSPVELHRRLRAELSTVSYHVRVLASYGLIEMVEERPSRGSVQHFYVLNPAGRRAVELAEAAGMLEPGSDEEGETKP